MQESMSAEELRARLSDAEPALLRLMDDCRRLFGARLIAIRAPGFERGWGAWQEVRANAIPWEGPAKFDSKAEWQRIRSVAFGSNKRASRMVTRSRVCSAARL